MNLHRAMLAAGIEAPAHSPVPATALAWSRQLDPTRDATQHALVCTLAKLDAMRYGAKGPAEQSALRRTLSQAIAQAKAMGQQRATKVRQVRN